MIRYPSIQIKKEKLCINAEKNRQDFSRIAQVFFIQGSRLRYFVKFRNVKIIQKFLVNNY